MAFAPGEWLRDTVGVYIGNATAVRDFRVQLRGNRAVLLWALYLIVLIGFGLITYSEAAATQQLSIVEAQYRLKDFYEKIMYLLSTVMWLIAPALTATSIVAERQRKSLDLVFSSPVSPKYYLVGKMIGSYRYIWMLLVLSLPVTAACVVLGGAVWSEVLAAYALLSLNGLVYTAIGLLFSTLSQKPVGAVVWSYIGVSAYIGFAAAMGAPLLASSRMWMGPTMGQSMNEMPFVVAMVPYLSSQTAASYMDIAGYHVPNWLLAAVATLVVVRLLIAGAGSALSPYGSRETKSVRIHGLVYMFLLSVGSAAAIGASIFAIAPMVSSAAGSGGPGGYSYTTPDYEIYFARQFLSVVLLTLIIVIPFITCFGVDLEKKFWPDGLFNIRRMLIATPSGGLPYLMALVLAAAGGIATYGLWHPEILGVRFFAHVFFALALVFACWSLGRLTSAVNNGLRYARTLQFTVILLLFVLPLPFLAIADSWGYSTPNGEFSSWDLYILRPLFSTGDKTWIALAYGILLCGIGFVLTRISEKTAHSKYSKIGLSYGRT